MTKYDKTWYWCKKCKMWRLHSTYQHTDNSNKPTNQPTTQKNDSEGHLQGGLTTSQ